MPFPNPATQFKPGNPGGPGRKQRAEKLLTKLVLEALERNGKGEARAVVEAWLREAKAGSSAHLKELLDRTEGKVADVMHMSVETVNLEWPDDAATPDAEDASGADGGADEPGAVQGPGVREALGEDPFGGGAVP